jgi:hypothetical protein
MCYTHQQKMDKGAIICAVVVILILFLILGNPKKYFGSEKLANGTACGMCSKLPNGVSCKICKRVQSTEHLQDIGACANLCDRWPGSQSCAACLNSEPQSSDEDLRGAVIGLLEQ